MSPQTDAERELAQLLVESLNLEEVEPGSIDPEAPLFNTGLGLDSIDALELALAISRRHGFQLRSDNDQNRRIFAPLRALSAHLHPNHAACPTQLAAAPVEPMPRLSRSPPRPPTHNHHLHSHTP